MLRGGPLAEKRVIQLVNRRFVAFYFNVGRGGLGYDAAAAKFIARVDKRFSGSMVPTPPVWVFAPDGELLVTIDNYAPKDRFFDALVGLLRTHPAYDADTDAEAQVFAAATKTPDDAAAVVRAGQVREQLGRYDAATTDYRQALKAEVGGAHALAAWLGLARIARYRKAWPQAVKALQAVSALEPDLQTEAAADVAAERGHHLLATRQYAQAYTVLAAAAKRYVQSPRRGELHFYAGVAAWFRKQKDWANFHWCFVMHEIPSDHHYMRCYLAATAEAMPFPNPELGGYRGPRGMISHALADAARDRAMQDFERLWPAWERRSAGAGKTGPAKHAKPKLGPNEADF